MSWLKRIWALYYFNLHHASASKFVRLLIQNKAALDWIEHYNAMAWEDWL